MRCLMKITDEMYRTIKLVCLIVIAVGVAYIAYNIPRIINVLIDIAVAGVN